MRVSARVFKAIVVFQVCAFNSDPGSRFEESFESVVKVWLGGYARRLEVRGTNADEYLWWSYCKKQCMADDFK